MVGVRSKDLNERDRRHVDSMRSERAIVSGLLVDGQRPSVEPMLWLPDVVAGVVGAARSGDPQFLDVMRHTVTELETALQ